MTDPRENPGIIPIHIHGLFNGEDSCNEMPKKRKWCTIPACMCTVCAWLASKNALGSSPADRKARCLLKKAGNNVECSAAVELQNSTAVAGDPCPPPETCDHELATCKASYLGVWPDTATWELCVVKSRSDDGSIVMVVDRKGKTHDVPARHVRVRAGLHVDRSGSTRAGRGAAGASNREFLGADRERAECTRMAMILAAEGSSWIRRGKRVDSGPQRKSMGAYCYRACSYLLRSLRRRYGGGG